MDPAMILSLISAGIKVSKEAYEFYKQIVGDMPIPTYDEILNDNTILQGLIDQEKTREIPITFTINTINSAIPERG